MTGWYVFGVVPSDAAPPRGTYLVEQGALAAVAAEVSLDEFGEEALVERLNDRAWVEAKALAHEAVLRAFVGATPVVPLRFGAIYRDLGDVRRLLVERGDFFDAALERVRGRSELGVKIWHDASRAAAPPARDGRAYLERRRGELAADRTAVAAAGAVHERLLALAVDGVANPPQPRELTGRRERMLLNAAYLVDDGDGCILEEVERLAGEHAPAGLLFEVTGPWPPYNFAREEEVV